MNLTASLRPEDGLAQITDINELLKVLLKDEVLPSPDRYILHTGQGDLIPGSKELHHQESSLRMEMGTERFLSCILTPLRRSYDYILIDTNRANSPLLINALTAADSVLIPICPTFYSTEGLSDIVSTILKNRRRLNPDLKFEGILFANCDLRTRLYRETRADVEAAFGKEIPVFQTAIPHTVQVEEAVRRGMTVLEYAPDSKVSAAFRALGEEVIVHGNQSNVSTEEDTEHGGNSPCLLVG